MEYFQIIYDDYIRTKSLHRIYSKSSETIQNILTNKTKNVITNVFRLDYKKDN